MDHEVIEDELKTRPLNVNYPAEWSLDADLACRVASDATLAANPENQ